MAAPGLTLNTHGKNCLRAFIFALSGTDIMESQLDYLCSKELVDHCLRFPDYRNREDCANHCLTDLGMQTAKRYFPKFRNWDQ